MIYRAYCFKELTDSWTWDLPVYDSGGYQIASYEYKVKDTLAYADSGVVSSWSIDEDYMVNNNSTIGIAKATEAVPGQIVVLIKDSGAYDMGVITAVDNEKLQITYKPMTYLLDVDVLNPMRKNDNTEVSSDGEGATITETDTDGNETVVQTITYRYDAVQDTAKILGAMFCTEDTDRYLRLPLRFIPSGNVDALWSYTDDTINLCDWVKDLFDNYNIVLTFGLTFENARSYITVEVKAATGGGWIIKDNIAGMDITHTDDSSAKATVCHVLDKETKKVLQTYYLISSNDITSDPANEDRVQPYKLTTTDADTSDYADYQNADGTFTFPNTLTGLAAYADYINTLQTAAEGALLYSDFNHYISVQIPRDSKMYPTGITLGDSAIIVPEIEDMETVDGDPFTAGIDPNYEDKVWSSIYTGRKEKSNSTLVTLVFGKMRINYTDLVQMKYAKKARS